MTQTSYSWTSFGEYFLDDIIRWIGNEFYPEDVFSFSDLERWAEKNDYVKKEESEE